MRVRFYETASGRVPVLEYLDTLQAEEAAGVAEVFVRIERQGLSGSGVTTRQISGKLWEVKISAQRVFYVLVTGPEIVFLHAYKKQGAKAPIREIETAERRLRQVLGAP